MYSLKRHILLLIKSWSVPIFRKAARKLYRKPWRLRNRWQKRRICAVPWSFCRNMGSLWIWERRYTRNTDSRYMVSFRRIHTVWQKISAVWDFGSQMISHPGSESIQIQITEYGAECCILSYRLLGRATFIFQRKSFFPERPGFWE